MKQKERVLHYDLLRILACFSVVMLHSAAHFWYDLPVKSGTWMVLNSIDALSRYGVPLFVMLSGIFFLVPGGTTDRKKLFTHNILKLLVVYLFWSCFYAGVTIFEFGMPQPGLRELVKRCLCAKYHLWFLPMLIGIYLLVPMLQTWVNGAKKRDLEYVLMLFVVLQILGETLRALFWRTDEVGTLLDTFRVELVCGYAGYFLLGYYLHNYEIGKKQQRWIYLAGVLGAVCNVVFSSVISYRAGTPRTEIYDSFSIFTFAMVVAIFLFFRNVVSGISMGRKVQGLIQEVSATTLGIYLLHIFVMEHTNRFFAVDSPVKALLIVPVYGLAVMIVCGLVSGILRRIPFVGRFLV